MKFLLTYRMQWTDERQLEACAIALAVFIAALAICEAIQ